MPTRSSKNPPPETKETNGGRKMGGEHRSGPVAGTAVISGVTFANKGLLYADVEGVAMFEGDIVLGTVSDVQQADADADAGGDGGPVLQSVGISGQQFRWPNARVPYEIDPALPNPQRVTDAIAHWEANTRIRFVLRTAANQAQFPDFMRFVPGGGCSSMVGRRGGQQNITLGSGCTTGNAIHEIGHTVGLWHEQSREDRDTFVRIVFANIDPAMQHNFSQHVADGDDLGAYDFGSVMHYPPTAFSINGQPTIVARQALPPGVVMGQRTGLSPGDINGVHAMYPPPVTIKEVAKDPIADPTFKEARKDPITETVKEVRKDPITDATVKEIRKDPISDTVKEIRKDPIQDTLVERVGIPRPQPGFDQGASVSPFVLATPSRAGQGDPVAEASAQVQQIVEAIAMVEQQQAELLAAYDAAVQMLDAAQQGQV